MDHDQTPMMPMLWTFLVSAGKSCCRDPSVAVTGSVDGRSWRETVLGGA